jgi:hypothetical protein
MLSPMLDIMARTKRVLTTEDEERLRILVAALEHTKTSQSTLAERIGVDFSSVNRWMNRWNKLNLRSLHAALIALGLPPDWRPPTSTETPPPPTTH